jgi:hypothetical protein
MVLRHAIRATYCLAMVSEIAVGSDTAPIPTSATDRAQRLLLGLAALAVVGTLLALVLVQRVGNTYRDGLEVARDGAEVASVSTATARQLASDVAELARAASSGLEQTRILIELVADSTADVGAALGTNLATAVEGIANIANGMAGFIETIERLIPGDSQSLAEDLRSLAEGLEPVPDQLRSLGDQLLATSDQLLAANESLREVEAQLDVLAVSIDDAQATLVEVDALAADVAVRADLALDRSQLDLWLLRMLIVVLGVGFFIACIAARHAVAAFAAEGSRAGGGTRTHTPSGTGT